MGSLWNGLQKLLGTVISFFYDLIPNVGVAIILLTIAVGVVMFPLTLKQTRSMKSMQEIQPELKRLQKELKGDKEELQKQTMALYKERGVNPAAGCLPLLLQMPIWFALFQVLRQFAVAVPTQAALLANPDLVGPDRFLPVGSSLAAAVTSGQPLSFLWMDMRISPSAAFQEGVLTALPYLITIFVVMGTAYWQQRQTMARSQNGGQDKQPGQAVMKIFPVFFGFISFTLPAGLVVYFAASQIFRIGQQALIIGMDDKKKQEKGGKASAPSSKAEKAKPSKPEKADPKKADSPKPATPRPATQGRPQGSKKKRGKKRRRR
ncbi:MAG: YidC/Oxa1 family membrane protein insertase [Actinobacteria bacterium]|nr:YidC/Oxa1 family membrane protein insertase [Actinomycetota bacterium]MBU1493202.1 YidC/Oxa1 family membrane protein insertase [Actinomycetota bacterium]MBU1866396.1 YidC/Oxa1 family membrane protein insertase [Actinomycetota bacterium]